ncbi:hypothetical protein [Nannocystis pusilla]|uniref:hypothetical protein n=1 Tax=Nannocystis pusilla TaxID=889268 RepID=UPI003B79CDBA
MQAELLRFRDRAGAAAAVRAWLAAAPDDPEAWWRVIVAQARAGEPEGWSAGWRRWSGCPVRRRCGCAGGWRGRWSRRSSSARGRARAVLEDMSWSGGPAAQAEGWRALAIARAGDPQVAGEQVEAAVSAALAAGRSASGRGARRRSCTRGWRRQGAAAGVTSRRPSARRARSWRRRCDWRARSG